MPLSNISDKAAPHFKLDIHIVTFVWLPKRPSVEFKKT